MKNPLIFGRQGQPVHFLHANGYPPETYRSFLANFSTEYQVAASYLRPLWEEGDYLQILDWTLFRDDLLNFIKQADAFPRLSRSGWKEEGKIIGLGHSIGATVTLMAALQRPELFRTLVLIEPVLFPPWLSFLMEKLSWVGLVSRFHPLIKRARRRKKNFENREAMFANYREKSIFQGLSDKVLSDYVQGLARDHPRGGITLAYPPHWEAQIYATSGIYDRLIWRALAGLELPVLVIRGEKSDTLKKGTVKLIREKIPSVEVREIPSCGHLAPLEKPAEVYQAVIKFLV